MLELCEAEARPLVDSAGRSVAARPGAHSADVLGAAGYRRCWRLSAVTPALSSLRATRLQQLWDSGNDRFRKLCDWLAGPQPDERQADDL
jgi:hypothetical protein